MERRLPFKNVDDVMRRTGAKRISDKAINTMIDILEEYCVQITTEALMLARHGKRRTIKDTDILLALRRLRGV